MAWSAMQVERVFISAVRHHDTVRTRGWRQKPSRKPPRMATSGLFRLSRFLHSKADICDYGLAWLLKRFCVIKCLPLPVLWQDLMAMVV
jgi:hypothetical protein